MRVIRWRIKKAKKAYEQYQQKQYEQSDSWSPKTTRVACSRRPWKQPARPQEPPNALRNAADRPSAPWAQQDARCTARPGVGTADSPSAACAPQNARVPCSASTPAGGTPAAPAKEPEAASPPAGGTPKPSRSRRRQHDVNTEAGKTKTEGEAVSRPAGGKPKSSGSAPPQDDVKTEAVTPSATSASAPPPWTRPPIEEALRVEALNEVAKRRAGDELQSPAKRPKSAAQEVESNPHQAYMEESTADEVQEEVKEEEDSEDPPPDDEEDWLAKGPRGDYAHGCPSEL